MPRWYCPHLRASCPSTPPGKSCCQPPRYPNSPTPTPGPLRTKRRCRYNQAGWSRAETQGKRQEGTAHWPWPHPSSTWDPPGGARGVGSPQPTLQRWGERRRPLPSQPGPTCHQLCSRMKSGAGGSEKLGLKTKGRPFNGSWVPLNPNSLSSIPATPGLPSPPPHWAGAEKGLLLTIRGAQPDTREETWSLTCVHRHPQGCLEQARAAWGCLGSMVRSSHPMLSRGLTFQDAQCSGWEGGRGRAGRGPLPSSGVPVSQPGICCGGRSEKASFLRLQGGGQI